MLLGMVGVGVAADGSNTYTNHAQQHILKSKGRDILPVL